jgi:hypothetical protein
VYKTGLIDDHGDEEEERGGAASEQELLVGIGFSRPREVEVSTQTAYIGFLPSSRIADGKSTKQGRARRADPRPRYYYYQNYTL